MSILTLHEKGDKKLAKQTQRDATGYEANQAVLSLLNATPESMRRM
jgi:hypothetical protein